MTEEEKQLMMAMILRMSEEKQRDLGGHMMAPPQAGEQPQQRMSQSPQQQGGGTPPGMSEIGKYMAGGMPASGAGSALTATEAAAFTPSYAPSSLAVGGSTANAGMGTAMSGNVGGAAGGGSMMAAAGPWAALAAVIAANENEARKQGRRDEDKTSHFVDLLSGAVLEQDAEALGDKIGGPLGQFTETMGEMGNPEGIWRNIKKTLEPWEWF